MNNIKIEETQHQFIADGFLRPSSFIRRFSNGKDRFYYSTDNDEITLYASATTLIKDGYAEDKMALEGWRNKLRLEGKNPTTELEYLALRGTIMHILVGELIQGHEVDLKNLSEYLSKVAPEILMEPLFADVISNEKTWLVKALLAFVQFAKDYNVKPLAIELILKSDKYQVASPIDLIVEMDVEEKGEFGEVYKTGPRKGEPKETKRIVRKLAIVDLKSSQNGFYDSHYFQLQLYKRILEENYPELKVEALFNWSPKDFVKAPTYNLKDQLKENDKLECLCELVFEQGKVKHLQKRPKVSFHLDTLSLNSNIDDALESVDVVDYLKKHHSKK